VHNGIGGNSRGDDDVQNKLGRRVNRDAEDRNAGLLSNPRSKRITRELTATEASTVPQVQFPELLDGERRPGIRVYRLNHADDARKEFGPSVQARAELVFI
jgi:hypothetical protein